MGFLERVKKAAETAKEELDKSGVLDQLRGGDDQPAPPPEPEAWELQSMVDTIRRGGLDPRTLISRAEVEAIAGHPVDEPRVSFNGDFTCADFDWEDRKHHERYGLYSYHRMDDEGPFDPEEHWQFLQEGRDDTAIPLPGLGDEAYAMYDSAYTKASGRVLWATVSGDALTEDAKRVRAESMLRTAVRNLERSPSM